MVSVAPLTFCTTDPSEIVDVIEFSSALTVADLALAIPTFMMSLMCVSRILDLNTELLP